MKGADEFSQVITIIYYYYYDMMATNHI